MKAKDIAATSRSEVRYRLYRIRTDVEDGVDAAEFDETRRFYEDQPGFLGWWLFARRWDVAEEGQHDQVVRRARTEEQEWNERLMEVAVVIGSGDGS